MVRNYNKNKIIILLSSFFLLLNFYCDHGIDPKDWIDPGFGGTITFIGKSPPKDSLFDLRLVIYKKYPPPIFLNFVKYSEEGIPVDNKTYKYKMYLEPGTYEYIVVAQQYGPNLFLHWRAVGFYSLHPEREIPSSITITENTFLDNIDFLVDFDHLPVQPFLSISRVLF